jgi:hypothetical protein
MPWYTRKSYFGSPSEPGDVTHSLVLEAADEAQAIKLATKTRFLPGTIRSELLDEKGGRICALIVRRS